MSRTAHTSPGGTKQSSSEFRTGVGLRLGHVLAVAAEARSAAKSFGCSPALLEAYVAGKKAPPFEKLAQLAASTGVSLDWLASGEEPIMRAPSQEQAQVTRPVEPAGPARTSRVEPETLAIVIRAILEALDEERLTLYTYATSELIALVYEAVCDAESQASSATTDPVEVAKDKLRRVLPLILSGRLS